MIYLYHTPILALQQQKQTIYQCRDRLLADFCQSYRLPIPIITKDKLGKPYCQNIPDLAFNHSHCQTDYALAYSLTVRDIGVDIENIGRRVNFLPFAERFFHSDEVSLWQLNSCDLALWFKIWTIKEAVLKASGIGIRLPLNELKAVFIDDDTGYVYHQEIGKFYFYNILIDDCMVTVAYPFECGKMTIVI